MIRHGLVCLLFAAMAWGQAAQKPAPQAQPAGTTKPATPEAPKAPEVAPDAVVITINGVCDNPGANASANANCKMTITRAQFEQLVDSVQPNLPQRARRQFATRYADALAMSKKAEAMGLDHSPSFDERMRLARIQVLSQELNKALQEKASQISDADISDYYQKNQKNFEEAEMDRIYVPKTQEFPEAAEGDKKLSDEEEQKRDKESEQTMKAAADKLHARAVKGEDFAKLQEDAFNAAGIKTGAPTASLAKMRRSMLPATQVSVMDLKPGEISDVITDTNGYFIYKVKTKDTIALDQAKDEIRNTLRSQRMQEEMQKVQQSSTQTLNDDYFGPETARGPMPPRPGMPLPPIKPGATGPR